MMFKSDAQRKAVFASMSSPQDNKFSHDNLYSLADIEEGRSIGAKVMVRPKSEYDVISEDLKQEAKYDVGGADESWRKNMRKKYQMMVTLDDAFKQQKELLQRKSGVEEAVQPVVPIVAEKKLEGKKPEEKFAMRPFDKFVDDVVTDSPYAAEGYTGATLDVSPIVTTKDGSRVIPENTVILAGEGYKAVAFPKKVIAEMVDKESVESGVPKEEIMRMVPDIEAATASSAERYLRKRPVFSDAAQDLESEAAKYMSSIRRLEESGDPMLLAAAQRSINKVSGDVGRAVKDIKFTGKPGVVKMETPIGTLDAKPEFAEEMKTAKLIKPEPRDYLGELKAKGAVMKTFDPTK